MTVEKMREAITNAYPGLGWMDHVARMEDDQVIAIYHSCEERGMFEKNGGKRVKQLSIDDILGKNNCTRIDWEVKYSDGAD